MSSSDKENSSFFAASHGETIIECEISDIFVGEALNFMILATGCASNMSGKLWSEYFLESLNNDGHTMVKIESSKARFKFGGGRILLSLFKVHVLILVAGSHIL